jgi:thiol-disulfide isomerase/thioredoxin
VIAAVVIAGIIAIVTTTGGDDGEQKVELNAREPAETAAVKVDGEALPQFQSPVGDRAIGRAAPILHGSTFAGKPITVPADDGNAKAIFFVAHWCPHCRAEIPRLSEWLKTHELPAGVSLAIVSTRVGESPINYPPSAWLRSEGVGDIPTLADDPDNTAYVAYGRGGLPYVVYLDKDDKVVLRTAGEYGDDPNIYTELFNRLAGGEPLTNPRG